MPYLIMLWEYKIQQMLLIGGRDSGLPREATNLLPVIHKIIRLVMDMEGFMHKEYAG